MLLVDDHEAEVAEAHVVLDQGVGAYHYMGLAGGYVGLYAFLVGGLDAAYEQLDADAEAF